MKDRLVGVRERTRPGILPLTEDEAGDHLKRTLAGSDGQSCEAGIISGTRSSPPALRRVSTSALIDEWVGHSTEQQRKRYRHLYPSVQSQALRSVFG